MLAGWRKRPQPKHSGRSTLIRYGVPFLLCLGLTVVRTHGISQSFWLHGDQIRDWAIALGPWHDLPLSGTPSTVGGRATGPVFYWTLWLIRIVVGPATGNLPHAGGIGLSIIQSLADGVLLMAIWSRLGSLVLALAIVLAGATSPFDLALSATIWNPPLAVALVKLAMAAVLAAGPRPSRWRALSVTAARLAGGAGALRVDFRGAPGHGVVRGARAHQQEVGERGADGGGDRGNRPDPSDSVSAGRDPPPVRPRHPNARRGGRAEDARRSGITAAAGGGGRRSAARFTSFC